MIIHECPNCNTRLEIPEQYAGQRGKCERCGNEILVSDVSPASVEPESKQAGEAAPVQEDDGSPQPKRGFFATVVLAVMVIISWSLCSSRPFWEFSPGEAILYALPVAPVWFFAQPLSQAVKKINIWKKVTFVVVVLVVMFFFNVYQTARFLALSGAAPADTPWNRVVMWFMQWFH